MLSVSYTQSEIVRLDQYKKKKKKVQIKWSYLIVGFFFFCMVTISRGNLHLLTKFEKISIHYVKVKGQYIRNRAYRLQDKIRDPKTRLRTMQIRPENHQEAKKKKTKPAKGRYSSPSR